jgi:aminoglycoside phosphotransferase (APT) family kinase protein
VAGRETARIEVRHGWLPAVLPAQARRFRVSDSRLAATLAEAGAEVVESAPDVEIGPPAQLVGDAPHVIVSLDAGHLEEGPSLLRAGRRIAKSAAIRTRATTARRMIRLRGYPDTSVVTWDHEHVIRASRRNHLDHRAHGREWFPLGTAVVGTRDRTEPTILEVVASVSSAAANISLEQLIPRVASGLIVAISPAGVLRVAVGPARSKIEAQKRALDALRSADPPLVVSERVPWLLAHGESGLAVWSVERIAPGTLAPPSVTGRLLEDCIDFLLALYATGPHHAERAVGTPRRPHAEVIATACDGDGARTIMSVGRRIEGVLADLPRGFGHGDFWSGNLLTDGERLVGVVDWDAAGLGRPPLLDLLHLVTAARGHQGEALGPAVVDHLLPWARAGGDEIARSYLHRLGVEASRERLEALALAYWMERVAHQLDLYADRRRQHRWLEANVALVLRRLRAQKRV